MRGSEEKVGSIVLRANGLDGVENHTVENQGDFGGQKDSQPAPQVQIFSAAE